jgi:hypothetical protein
MDERRRRLGLPAISVAALLLAACVAPGAGDNKDGGPSTLDAGLDAAAARDGGGAGGTGGTPPPPPPPPPKLCALTIQCDRSIPDEPKIACRFEIRDGAGATVFSEHAGVELHGRSSLRFPKKSYSVELRDAAGGERSVDLLGMGAESDWVLDGSWVDRSFMRNALVYDVFRAFGAARYAAEGRFCTLTLNGEGQGIYRLVERIKRDGDRVAIGADDDTGRSFIIKQDEEGAGTLSIGLQRRWRLVYPREEMATSAQVAGVQRWLDGLGAALSGGNPADPTTGVLASLDPDATADWILIQELAKNIDAYNLSLHFVRDGGGLARIVPWDFDLSFGQPMIRNQPGAMNESPSGWIVHRTAFIGTLEKVPALMSRLAPRWRALRAGPLATAAMLATLDRYAVTLAGDAISQNFARWPLAEIDYQSIYPPYTLYPVSSHEDEKAKLRAFLEARLAWIDAHIDAYPN